MIPALADKLTFDVSAGTTVLTGSYLEALIAQNVSTLAEGDVFGFLLDTYTQVIPEPILALLVVGPIGVAYYMVTRSFAIPLVMAMLIGAVVIVEFPLAFQNGLVAMFTIMVLVLLYVVFQRVRVQ
ncbi:MAG: hypothetical protein RI531_08670 [Haloferacaceae archaeon]|nr:hypothetical protein [Haloferacaceae archaeon]